MSPKWLLTLTTPALLIIACGDGGPTATPSPTAEVQAPTLTTGPTPTGTPLATPSPTPAGETGGMEGFRAFAVQIEAALADGDFSTFAESAIEIEVTCTGDAGPHGACRLGADALPAGTVLRGIPIWTNAVEGGSLRVEAPADWAEHHHDFWYRNARPDFRDEYGGGQLRLYALAHVPAISSGDCTSNSRVCSHSSREPAYAAIATRIFQHRGIGPQGQELRQVLVLTFEISFGDWRLRDSVNSEGNRLWLAGECTDCYEAWERWEGAP